MRKEFYFFGLALLLIACNNEKKADSATAFEKLPGVWQLKNQPSYERWTKTDEHNFVADDYVLSESDTVFTEKISLSKKGTEGWTYNVQLLTQDTLRQVTFTIDSISENMLRFANPQNTFPKSLLYHFPNDTIMQVTLDGEDAVPVYLVFKKQS